MHSLRALRCSLPLSAYKLPARMRVAACSVRVSVFALVSVSVSVCVCVSVYVSLSVCVCVLAAALCVVLTQPSERALRIRHVFRDDYCGFACANEVSACT